MVLALWTPLAGAEPNRAPPEDELRKKVEVRASSGLRRGLKILGEDARAVFGAPARWRRRGWSVFGSVLAATALVYAYDEEIRDQVRESSAPDRKNFADGIAVLGRAEVGAVLPWVSYGLASAAGSTRFKRSSLVAFEAWVLSAAATAALKGASARLAPPDGDGNDFWKGGDVFPSGHTARTFAIAAVFAERHGARAAWIGYPVATLVGLARIETNAHWASDVVAGAALGISIGRAVARRHPIARETGRQGPPLWMLQPVPGGLLVRLSF
ncbi:MAG: phosphatase PAP2 family protein [Acidobacteriota bacterium]